MANKRSKIKLNALTIPPAPTIPPGIKLPKIIKVPSLPAKIDLKVWVAWHNRQPGASKDTLHIRGWVGVTNPMDKATLKLDQSGPQIPETLHFKVAVKSAGPPPFIPMPIIRPVVYDQVHKGIYTNVVIKLPTGKVIQVPVQEIQ